MGVRRPLVLLDGIPAELPDGDTLPGGGAGPAAWWGAITDAAAVAITAADTATIDRLHVVSGTSANYTIALPAVGDSAGHVVGFVVRDYAAANQQYTLDAGAGVLVAGRSRYLRLTWNCVALLYSDGTRWLPLTLCLESDWVDTGPVTITGSTTNPTKGTRSPDKLWMRRNGAHLHYRLNYEQTVANGTAGSGDYRVDLPMTMTTDSNLNVDGGTMVGHYHGSAVCGYGRIGNTSNSAEFMAVWQSATPRRVRFVQASGAFWGSGNYPLSAICRVGMDIFVGLSGG